MNWRVDFPVLLKVERNMPDASHETLGALAQNFIKILCDVFIYQGTSNTCIDCLYGK